MKKLIAILLATALLLSLVACGSDANNDAQPSSEPPDSHQPVATVPDSADTPASEEATAPSNDDGSASVGQVLRKDFQDRVAADPSLTAQELADALLSNEAIEFAPASMPVEEGLLNGFGNAEITGFSEGVQFGPVIGSIAFIGYIFILDADTDGDAFVQTLKDNADLRWNVCVAADELIVERVGSTVLFLMSPLS